jgi:hypothetical protein
VPRRSAMVVPGLCVVAVSSLWSLVSFIVLFKLVPGRFNLTGLGEVSVIVVSVGTLVEKLSRMRESCSGALALANMRGKAFIL